MRFLYALPLVVLALAGCSKPSIAGRWNMSGGNTPPGSSLVAEFKDPTFTVNAEVAQGGANVKFSFSGDYSYDGKKLKMTGKTVTLDESTLPAIAKSMAGDIKKSLEKAVLTTQEGDVKLEGDVMTFTTEGKDTTFTRIK